MKVSREFSIGMLYVLDQWVPPALRDAKWFMRLPMKLVFGKSADDFMYFKGKAFAMTDEEFSDVYRRTAAVSELQGETDLNEQCTKAILASLGKGNVLEVGAGRGYLANLMSETNDITASDILVSDQTRDKFPRVTFVETNLENLPFADNSFDTVVTTHTLEHVQHLAKALAELRRVAKKQLIIVVPRQRPYKYGFSLHINFFPYAWSLQGQFGYRKDATIQNLGDWFYVEPNPTSEA